MKKLYNAISGTLLVIGFLLLFASEAGITALAIGSHEQAFAVEDVLGLFFIIMAALIFVAGNNQSISSIDIVVQQNEAQKYLKQNHIVTKQKELQHLAISLGYQLKEGSKHTGVFDKKGNRIAEIPHHPEINRNTAKIIMKELATGKSSYHSPYQTSYKDTYEEGRA